MPKKILPKKKIKKEIINSEYIDDKKDDTDENEETNESDKTDENDDEVEEDNEEDNEEDEDNEVDEHEEENDFDNDYNDDNESVCDIQNLIEENNNDEHFNEEKYDDILEYVSKEERQSSNRLTKYEMVRIIGERVKQLTMGAKPLIKNHKDFTYDRIAIEELKLNMTPFKIRRPLPNGKYELYSLDELKKDHLLVLLDEI